MCPGEGWEQVPEGRWNCSSEDPLAGIYSLKHNFDNPENGIDFLVYTNERLALHDSVIYSFRIRHAYAPSSANNWQIALGAEFSADPPKIQTGIVFGVNFMGSDDLVKVWNLKDGTPQELFATPLNYQEEVGTESAPQFTLAWYPEGLLKLYYVKDPAKQKPEEIGSFELAQLPAGKELVIRYEYTSARDRGLWLDDLIFEGNFIKDTLAPSVTSIEVMDEHSLRIGFSEPLEGPAVASFLLDGEPPDSCGMDGNEIFLEFSNPIPNRLPLLLWIGNICDRENNCLRDTVLGLMRNEAVWGDVVFNELMADPDPAVLLPAEEYLELYNRSEYPLDLSDWRLHVNDRNYDLIRRAALDPDFSSPIMNAFSYKVIKGISLPNEGATLALYNEHGVLVHGSSYRTPWDGMDWKKEGGWSLESPDPHLLCLQSEWWTYSTDPSGGTPGRINSVFSIREDVEAPSLLYYGYKSPETLVLTYSEPLRSASFNPKDFLLKPGSIFPTDVKTSEPLSTQLLLSYPTGLQDRSSFYIDIPSLSDCRGNLSHSERIKGAKISLPVQGDLFINEIMFNPLEGNPEFVELYNPGPDYFDLSFLAVHVLESGASPHKPVALSQGSRIFLPGDYLVLASCIPHLRESYGLERSGCWLEVEDLPVLKNTGGSLYLTNRSGGVIDHVNYSDEQHMDLLKDSKGVSLERISIHRPGSVTANWHSAASMVGYATPGEKNSQSVKLLPQEKMLAVEPTVFSPDNDGYQDLLHIRITTPSPGWIIRLWISDLNGQLVRSLANMHIGGPSLSYGWDGERDQGEMSREGIYILHLALYHPDSGERLIRKVAIGVVYR